MRKDIVKPLELFVFKGGVLVNSQFDSKKWGEIYKKNSFHQSDHILKFALKGKREFFLWDHLSSTETEKIVHNSRCKLNLVRKGFTAVYEIRGYKIVGMFSVNGVEADIEKYICKNQTFFKDLINNIKNLYVESNHNELWKNISKTY